MAKTEVIGSALVDQLADDANYWHGKALAAEARLAEIQRIWIEDYMPAIPGENACIRPRAIPKLDALIRGEMKGKEND